MLTKLQISLAIPMAVILGLTGCAGADNAGDTEERPKASAAAAEEETPEVEKFVNVVTSMENPAPAGTPFVMYGEQGEPEYEVVVGPVDFDGTPELTALNPYITVLKPGYHFVIVPVEITYIAELGSGTPRDIGLSLEAADGSSTETGGMVAIPDDGASGLSIESGETGHRNWVFISNDASVDAEVLVIGSKNDSSVLGHYLKLK